MEELREIIKNKIDEIENSPYDHMMGDIHVVEGVLDTYIDVLHIIDNLTEKTV